MEFYADGLPINSQQWFAFPCSFQPVTQAVSIPLCMRLDLQLSFYRPLCYNSRVHSTVVSTYYRCHIRWCIFLFCGIII